MGYLEERKALSLDYKLRSLLVNAHSVVGSISLFKRFLPDLVSYPRWCADGFGDRRQENVPPVSKGCFIVLAKPVVLGANHRLI
jgi:hypothetical protein